jgi:hypothetical protein
MSKPKTFEVEVEVVPTSGRPKVTKVTVPASATLKEVLEAGGIDGDKKDFTVDGQPANLDTRVNSVSSVKVAPKVTVTERPRGS